MDIIYSKHFLDRKKLRKIPDGIAEKVITEAIERYKDTETGYLVAVKQLHFQGKNRELALTYTKMQDKIIMITFHPLKKGQKENRIQTGR